MKQWIVALFALLGLSLWQAGEASAQKSGASPNVLVLPKGPGSLGGVGENVRPNLNMGLMSYQIKVVVPTGRGSATPDPSITYSSSAGSGMVGIGWSFSAGSSIERGTVRGLPTYTNKDIFFAGGELVKIPNGPFYRARIEGGFVRYRWVQKDATDQQGYWIAEYPDGSKSYYGANSKGEARLDAQVYGTQGTFRWELVTRVDRNGNRVEYSYFKEGTMAYPDQIGWVFDDNDKPLYQLKFGYEDRPDHISDGKPGFDLQTTKRLKEVQITSNGQRFRSYHFDFEESTGLSRLIKVTRYGRDPQKAYPIQFTMKYSDAVFSPENSKMVTMPTSLGVDFRTNNLDFIDINGDGLPDVVDTSKAKHVFFMNELKLDKDMKQASHDYPQTLQVQNPTETSAQLSNASVQMLDYNGDGFTDLVDAVNKKVYLNKGDGKWTDSSTSLQNFPVTGKDPNMRFMDYDGDKKIDVISSDGNTTTFWLNDGKGNWTVQSGKVNIGLGFLKDKLRLIDINGDGLQDVVHITKNSLRYRKYLGVGNWTEWINVKVPDLDKYELDTKAQFADINGDGMSDMVAFLGNSIVYFVNKNGTEFTAGAQLQTFKGIDIPDSTKTTVRIVDINGNGSRDIVWIDSSGKVVYLELFGKRPNLMTTISNNIGQRINVDYGSSVYFYLRDKTCTLGTDKACAGPWQNKMPMAFTVVTKITTWASRSDKPLEQATPTAEERPQIQSIYYHNGFYDGNEKKFRGFRHVETLYDGDESVKARKDEIKFDVGDKDTYMHGKLLERAITDNAGTTYQQLRNTWKDCPIELGGTDPMSLDPPIRYICRGAQETTHVEGETDKSKWRTTRQEVTFDGFGNPTLQANLGDKDKQGDEKYLKKVYIVPKAPNDPASVWILRAVQQVLTCDAPPEGNARCAEMQYFYDGEAFKGLPAGELRKGNVTRIQMRQGEGDTWITPLRRKYDRYGNISAYKGLTEALHQVSWDEVYHRFSTKESVTFSGNTLEVKAKWDYAAGKIVESTDVNDLTTAYTYDTFGRMLTMKLPQDPAGDPSVRYTYELKAPLNRIIMERRSSAGGAFDRKQIQCFDGLGRKLQTRHRIDDKRYLVYTHTEYNRLGQRARFWKLYESDEACAFTAPKDTPTTSFFYDGMGRLIRRVNADETFERTVYAPFVTRHYDEADNDPKSPYADTPSTATFDGLRRLIKEVKIPEAGKTITMQYTHTAVNSRGKDLITSVTFDDGSKKENHYDLYGNLIKVVDPDRKEILFAYNTANQLVMRKDARGKEIVYSYDDLGRQIAMQEKGRPETVTRYFYDKPQKELPDATFLQNKLAKIEYPDGMYLFSYDEGGYSKFERHIVHGVAFDFQNTYNRNSVLTKQVMPDDTTFTFAYDGAGRMKSVTGLLKSLEYHPFGALKSWEGANGVRTTYAFDKRERMTNIEVKGAQDAVFSLAYTLDGVGNILKIDQTHGATAFASQYDYDALYRLTKASLHDDKEVLSFKQDALHNITDKTSSLADKSPVHIGAYTYDPKRIHQVTKAGKRDLKYDEAGHVTQLGALAFRWDHLGRRTHTERDGKVVGRYWYDAGNRRIIKEEKGLHTFYIHKDFVLRDGVGVSFLRIGRDRAVSVQSTKISAKFFDDVAGGKADGVISAADAWVVHGTKQQLADLKATLKPRPLDLDLTRDMLRASVSRLLSDGKDIIQYYHPDHLGSIRAVTDSSGKVIERKHYYPYGKIREQVGQATPYGYMDAELDDVTQTYRFLLRSLEPTIGRWLSPDPAFERIHDSADEFNSYGMVRNNPIRIREIAGAMGLNTLMDAVFHTPYGQGCVYGLATVVMVVVGGLLESGARDLVQANQGANLSARKTATRVLGAAQWASVGAIGFGLSQVLMYGNEGAADALFMTSYALSAAFEAGSVWLIHKQQQELKQTPARKSKGLQAAKGLRAFNSVAYTSMAIAYQAGALEDQTGQIVTIAVGAALFGLSKYAESIHLNSIKALTPATTDASATTTSTRRRRLSSVSLGDASSDIETGTSIRKYRRRSTSSRRRSSSRRGSQ